MGFCLFNHVAVAAEHLIRQHQLDRVAIIDLDVHHGNGTQHIFEARSDVFYISVHEHSPSAQFAGSGGDSEKGRGEGEGYTLNIPMKSGSGDAEYRRAIEHEVIPILNDYRPQFILLSMGFDTLSEDHMAFINLTPSSFTWLTRLLVEASDRFCNGRLVSVLEGGYDLPSLKKAAVNHIAEL